MKDPMLNTAVHNLHEGEQLEIVVGDSKVLIERVERLSKRGYIFKSSDGHIEYVSAGDIDKRIKLL